MNNSQFPDVCPVPPRMGKVGQSGTKIGVLATCGYNFCHYCQRSGCKTYVYTISTSISYVSRGIFILLRIAPVFELHIKVVCVRASATAFELPRSSDRGSWLTKRISEAACRRHVFVACFARSDIFVRRVTVGQARPRCVAASRLF